MERTIHVCVVVLCVLAEIEKNRMDQKKIFKNIQYYFFFNKYILLCYSEYSISELCHNVFPCFILVDKDVWCIEYFSDSDCYIDQLCHFEEIDYCVGLYKNYVFVKRVIFFGFLAPVVFVLKTTQQKYFLKHFFGFCYYW